MNTTKESYMDAKLFIDGQWVEGGARTPVLDKFDGTTVGSLPEAREEDVEAALAAAVRGAQLMAALPVHRRSALLQRVSVLLLERKEELAQMIAREAGKALKHARVEVDRAANTFATAAHEATRLHGETVPLDAAASGEGYFGFWVRRPMGVIAAISPFNFPLNLVAHKVAPALASGNAVVLKPSENTPLSAVLLARVLEMAGVPRGAFNLVHGPGPTVGQWLVTDPRVAKVSFTGSAAVGEHILSVAGVKKVTLELGNTSPVIIEPDADLDFAAQRCALGAFANAGQVCVSTQRIYAHASIFEAFAARLETATRNLVVGRPLDEATDVGPMIDEKEALRIERWVEEAKAQGARVAVGHRREGALYWPTILTRTTLQMKVMSQEVFAPVVCLVPYEHFDEALRAANATEHGLQAGVFTRDLNQALAAVRALDFGGVVINDVPSFRADHMPYGGNKKSGLGREGVRFAMEEMTNVQMVCIREGGAR